MRWTPGSPHVLYAPKSSHDDPMELFPRLLKIDALEFLARVITQVPEPKRHLLFYYGHYSNVARGRRHKAQQPEQDISSRVERQDNEPTLSPARKQALRRRWADLIRRVFELDPLVCLSPDQAIRLTQHHCRFRNTRVPRRPYNSLTNTSP